MGLEQELGQFFKYQKLKEDLMIIKLFSFFVKVLIFLNKLDALGKVLRIFTLNSFVL